MRLSVAAIWRAKCNEVKETHAMRLYLIKVACAVIRQGGADYLQWHAKGSMRETQS